MCCMKKRILFGLAAILYSVAFTGSFPSLIAEATPQSHNSCNISTNNYTEFAAPVYSHLYEQKSGYLTRVEYVPSEGALPFYEIYNPFGNIVETGEYQMDGSLWGGFFHGETYDYIVTGDIDETGTFPQTVLYVRRYAFDGMSDEEEQNLCTITLEDVKVTLNESPIRMDEEKGFLYIYTSCQSRIRSVPKKLNIKEERGESEEREDQEEENFRQANLVIVVNESLMTLKHESVIEEENLDDSAVHTHNCFVKVDDDTIYRLDQRDSEPRAVYLTQSHVSAKLGNGDGVNLLDIGGESGDPITATTIGGMELTEKNVVVVGSSVRPKQSSYVNYSNPEPVEWEPEKKKDIYVTVTNRQTMSTCQRWLSDDPLFHLEGEEFTTGTPQLVKINENAFMVMWEQVSSIYGVRLYVAVIDGYGRLIEEIKHSDGISLSDCQPILKSDGRIEWYVTDNSEPVFRTVKAEDVVSEVPQPKEFVYPVTPPDQYSPCIIGENLVVSVDELKETDYVVEWKTFLFHNPGFIKLESNIICDTEKGLQLVFRREPSQPYEAAETEGEDSASYGFSSRLLFACDIATSFLQCKHQGTSDALADGSLTRVRYLIPETVQGGEVFRIKLELKTCYNQYGTDFTDKFKVIDGSIRITPHGDIDKNGTAEIADAVLLSRICAEDFTLETSLPSQAVIDMDGNGIVNSCDIAELLACLNAAG